MSHLLTFVGGHGGMKRRAEVCFETWPHAKGSEKKGCVGTISPPKLPSHSSSKAQSRRDTWVLLVEFPFCKIRHQEWRRSLASIKVMVQDK